VGGQEAEQDKPRTPEERETKTLSPRLTTEADVEAEAEMEAASAGQEQAAGEGARQHLHPRPLAGQPCRPAPPAAAGSVGKLWYEKGFGRVGRLWYGLVCMGRSLVEVRHSEVRGAHNAGVCVAGRASALVSRSWFAENAFGVWVSEHGRVRVRHCSLVRCLMAPLLAENGAVSLPPAPNAAGDYTRGSHMTVEKNLFDNVPWSAGSAPASLDGEGNKLLVLASVLFQHARMYRLESACKS
jgi:hypothetical protein